MRIALFAETFLPRIDGVVTRLKNTIAELQKQGDQVLVFAPGEGPAEHEGARIVRMPGVRFPLYPELILSLPRAFIRKILTEFQPHLIHVADPVLLGIAGIYYADVLHIPLVASYHTKLPQYLHYYGLGAFEALVWRLIRVRHSRAELNLCTSSAMLEELRAHGIGRLHLWPPAVDTEAFHPRFALRAAREFLSQGYPDNPLLVYVGRLSPEKNIESLRPVLTAIPDARLAIVGNGPHRKKLEAHFAGTYTCFTGYQTGPALAASLASADAVIHPSQTETLGLVLAEALAAGVVVIGAREGGIPDLIKDGVNGFLFDPSREGDLTAVVRRTVSGLSDTESIRRSARTYAEQLSWQAATSQLRIYYEYAMNMPKPEKPPLARTVWMQALKKTLVGGMKVFLP
jgi:glycosyltransferase involved in cell wall biosynthesis